MAAAALPGSNQTSFTATKRKVQKQSVDRLAATGMLEGAADAEVVKSFTSPSTGATVPYVVLGRPRAVSADDDAAPIAPNVNLVLFHDLFDTYESSQILLKQVVRNSGQQALVFNYPGQAYTSVASDSKFNNDDYADVVNELLVQLNDTGEFCIGSSVKFHIVGVGFGGNVALSFVSRYALKSSVYLASLAGMTLCNAFAHVDSQLAAILHSSVNVFSCFPATKPDLPLSYFSRFLFSEAFVSRMTKDVCINMYAAVGNPLTLDDRIKLCNVVLRSVDNRAVLGDLPFPVVVLQCLDDVLVSVSNADTLLHGRDGVKNVWPAAMDADGGGGGPTGGMKHIGDDAIIDSNGMRALAVSGLLLHPLHGPVAVVVL